jgi:hypothetical protein
MTPSFFTTKCLKALEGGLSTGLSPRQVNLMGGLRYHDKKRLIFVIKRGESNTFYEQINALNDSIVQEWRELGNQAENFAESGIKIVIILDNASFHKKKDIRSKISAEMPHIIL